MPTAGLIINDPGATGSHPYCLFIDGLDVIKQPATAGGSAFGTLVDSVVVTEVLGRPGSLEFSVDDPTNALTPAAGGFVYFCDHRGRTIQTATDDLFRGIIVSRELVGDNAAVGRIWKVGAVSLDTLLDRRVIPSGVLPSGMDAAAAIQLVMAHYGDPRINFLDNEVDASISGPSMIATGYTLTADIPLSGRTVRQVLEAIVRQNTYVNFGDSSLNFVQTIQVDASGRLVAMAGSFPTAPSGTIKEGTGAGVAPYNTHAAPKHINVDLDTSRVVNAVYVRGVDAASSGWVVNDASIATYGRLEEFLEAPGAVNVTTRNAIGAAYLADHYAVTRISFTLAGTHDDLLTSIGGGSQRGWHVREQSVLYSSTGYWPDATTYMLAELTKTFSGGGKAMTLEMTWSAPAKRLGQLLYQRDVEGLATSIAGGRLAGTLGEVAVRVKAGIPTDADFDSARDGFVVVDTTNNVVWFRANGAWNPGAGYQYDYVQITSNVTVSATVEASADIVVTGSAVTYDGSTDVVLEFFSPRFAPFGSAGTGFISAYLFEDGSSIGLLGDVQTPAANAMEVPYYVAKKFRPTAASHTYSIRAIRGGGNGTIAAGAGGSGALQPAFIRITRA